MEFADGEGLREAEGLNAVVEVGEKVNLFSREGFGEGRLVDAVEGAGGEGASFVSERLESEQAGS